MARGLSEPAPFAQHGIHRQPQLALALRVRARSRSRISRGVFERVVGVFERVAVHEARAGEVPRHGARRRVHEAPEGGGAGLVSTSRTWCRPLRTLR
jgi:hypothetical protein